MELDNSVCELLNGEWSLQLQQQYTYVEILAGSIFFNARNGQAVINNTIEVFGRKHRWVRTASDLFCQEGRRQQDVFAALHIDTLQTCLAINYS